MNDWQSRYLGRGALPRDLSGFEIEAFFTYSESERRVIDDERGSPALKLALALQIGFLRMTGRLLEALRMVPPAVWRHLGAQFEIDAPDLASLRTMYRRRRTLFEQQDLACPVLGFHDVTEVQRRALVRCRFSFNTALFCFQRDIFSGACHQASRPTQVCRQLLPGV
jgi:hypothetical protein